MHKPTIDESLLQAQPAATEPRFRVGQCVIVLADRENDSPEFPGVVVRYECHGDAYFYDIDDKTGGPDSVLGCIPEQWLSAGPSHD